MQAQLKKAERSLGRRCPVMRKLIREHGPCTIAKNRKPHFHNLVTSIIGQQLSVKAASAIKNKVMQRTGAGKTFKVENFKNISQPQLRACGLSNSKARYILEIYRYTESGKLPLRSIGRKPDDEIRVLLQQVPGIGPWTADMFMMFSLNRLDILPLGDLAIRKAIRELYKEPKDADHERLSAAVEHLSPWRTVACWYLWRYLDG